MHSATLDHSTVLRFILLTTGLVRFQSLRLGCVQGKLLAGINSRVQLFRWGQKEDGNWEVTTETGHSGHVLALYLATRGDFIIVGMRFLHLDQAWQELTAHCMGPQLPANH